MQQQGNSPLPAVSLGTGIAGLVTFWCCLGWLFGIAAIVTGILGRQQAALRGQSQTMANVGLGLGIAAIVLSIVLNIILGVSGGFNVD